MEETWPMNGATDAYWRDAIEFVLSRPDPSASVRTSIPGTLEIDEEVVRWIPSAPLTPSTAYEVTLDSYDGSPTLRFTTSAFGTPGADPDALVGRTWAVDLADGRWAEPEVIGDVLSSYLTVTPLLGVTAVDAASLGLLGANDDPDDGATTQDPKSPTLDMTDFRLDGTVSSDGRSLGGVGVSGLVDTRGLVSLVGTQDPAGVCDLLAGFGVACEACPDGERYCVPIEIDRMNASEVRGLTLVEVTGGGLTCAAVGLLPVGWAVSTLARRRRRELAVRRRSPLAAPVGVG